MPDAVDSRIRKFLDENFPSQVSALNIPADQSLLESGLIDSIGVLSLVTFMEEEFGITVSDDEVLPDNLETIDRLVKFVTRKALPAGEER